MLVVGCRFSVVRLRVVMEMKMDMRLSIVCMCVDVNIRAIAKHQVQEARSQKDDHKRDDQFEEVCDVLGNCNANSNHEEAGDNERGGVSHTPQ